MTTAVVTPHAAKLDELVRRIVEAVHPLRIILFGSAARGEENARDRDVMVVMPEGTDSYQVERVLYPKMLGIGVSIDILTATPSQLKRYADTKGLIYRNVVREGVDLYVSPDY